MSNENAAVGDVRRKGGLGQRIAYACGNLGQAAFYNAMSTYFVTYVTSCLFVSYSKALAAQMIAVITGLIVVIRIAEIFIDPLLGNLVDNTTTKWGRFRPWQFIGGLVSSVLIMLIFSGMFGLVNVNTTLFIVLFVITFIVLDVFYSLRDISYWGMIPALSSDSHERSTYTALGTFTGSIGYNGITVIVIPIVSYFTWTFTGAKGQGQAGWTSFGFIVALLGLITAWTVAFGTKESTSALRAKAQKNGNPFEAFKALFQNDQLLWVALSYLLYAIANVITTGVMYYLFVFVLDEPAAFSITGIIPLIAGFIMAPLYPILNRWIPRRYLFTGGMVSMIIGYTMLALFSSNLPVVIVAPDLLLCACAVHPDDRDSVADRLHRVRPAEERQAQRGGHLVGASHARQDRRRDVQRCGRCRCPRGWHDRSCHGSRHDRVQHRHVQDLRLLRPACFHHPQPRRVLVQGQDR